LPDLNAKPRIDGLIMDKRKVIEQVVKKLKKEIEIGKKASKEAFDTATDDEAYSDGKYDTRSLEASYLAGGQAQIVKELGDALQGFNLLKAQQFIQPPSKQVGLGSLLEIQSKSGSSWYIIGPGGGGIEVEVDGCLVTILTLYSPFGEAVASKQTGEIIELPNVKAEILKIV